MSSLVGCLRSLLPVLMALATGVQAEAPRQAAVASAHPLATRAGIEVLAHGGNAFDAAIAVATTLAVVEPYSAGLGGGGFWLLHEAESGRDVMIDSRERAPLAASRDMYLDASGAVVEGASVTGPLAAGIPGVVAAIDHLAGHYARLPLKTTLAPAIRLAREGFPVDEHYRKMARFRLQDLRRDDTASALFLQGGEVPEPGYRIVQTDLAETLQAIAGQGKKAFYQGALARQMVAAVRRQGGIWQLRDLLDYTVVERQPVTVSYRGVELTSAALPSSGGLVLAEMLDMLSAFDLQALSPAQRVHTLVEVMRRAYRDRAEYMGDTDYVAVPVAFLRSKQHIEAMTSSIQSSKATPSHALKPVAQPSGAGADTTHFSIVDAAGNRVSATLSINYPFGACFVAGSSGVLLNDEMDDFSIKPGQPNVYGLVGASANAIEPGKRMLSSMSPGFIESRDRVAVVGTPGGSRIITMLLHAILAFVDGQSAVAMVDQPRFHHQYLPDVVFFEQGAIEPPVQSGLAGMGHRLEAVSDYGNMHVVIVDKASGRVEAASDRRGVGAAMVLPER